MPGKFHRQKAVTWQATVHGVAKSQTQQSLNTHTHKHSEFEGTPIIENTKARMEDREHWGEIWVQWVKKASGSRNSPCKGISSPLQDWGVNPGRSRVGEKWGTEGAREVAGGIGGSSLALQATLAFTLQRTMTGTHLAREAGIRQALSSFLPGLP